MKHLLFEDILSYNAGKKSEEESFRIEEHLAECDSCAQRVYNLFVLREHFDEIWDSWTAKTHAQAMLQAYFAKAISEAQLSSEVEEKLRSWIENISQKTQAAIGIIIDAPKKLARVFQEELTDFFPEQALPEFIPVEGSIRVKGLAEKGKISLESKSLEKIKVEIDSGSKKIVVKTKILAKPWPLVILVLMTRGESKIFSEALHHPEDTDYLLAEFKSIPNGKYFLFLEAITSGEKER